ncbi:MAG: hypothetical protein PVH61_13895 [Candidatus Aminicenantes bacterium]|jgi:hypothetical protein
MRINYGNKTLVNTKNWKLPYFSFQKSRQDSVSIDVLPEGGRSSVETGSFISGLNGLAAHYDYINPAVPFEVLKHITLVTAVNPDLSQVVSNTQNMVNTGHKIVIQDTNSRDIDASMDLINEAAYEIYKHSAGVDGLFNHYANQGTRHGGISSEDVLLPNFRGVKKVVTVPMDTIRFKYIDDEYMPHQQTKFHGTSGAAMGLVRLNPVTYSYYSLQTIDNSPYALPPLLSALEPLILQKDAFKNLRYALKKLGLLGLNIVKVKPLQREPGESDDDYALRNQEHLKRVAESINKNFSEGLLVVPEGWEWGHHALTSDYRGVKEIVQLIEEQVFSGSKTHSALHGRPYSTTETYSTVIYNMYIQMASNLRRLIKRRQEKTYRLHLELNNLFPEELSLQFNKDFRLNPNTEAMASRYDIATVWHKVSKGMISPDEGAQELGYGDWYDVELLYQQITQDSQETASLKRGKVEKTFAWNSQKQRYVPQRNRIDLDRVKVKVSHKDDDKKIAEAAEKKMRELVEAYLRETLPYWDQLGEDVTDWTLEYVQENLEEISTEGGPEKLLEKIKGYIGEHEAYKNIKNDSWFRETSKTLVIDAGKYFKLDDLSVFSGTKPDVEFQFGQGDMKACELFEKLDNYYFSGYIYNQDFGSQIKEYVTKLFERGEVEFSQFTDDAKKEFKRLFGRALKGDIEAQMKRIVNSSLTRLRTYSYLSQLKDADFQYAEIVAVLDMATCEICRKLHGKRIPVGKAWDVYDALLNWLDTDDMEEAAAFIENSNVDLSEAGEDITDLLAKGKGIPPFHVLCKCILKAIFGV